MNPIIIFNEIFQIKNYNLETRVELPQKLRNPNVIPINQINKEIYYFQIILHNQFQSNLIITEVIKQNQII